MIEEETKIHALQFGAPLGVDGRSQVGEGGIALFELGADEPVSGAQCPFIRQQLVHGKPGEFLLVIEVLSCAGRNDVWRRLREKVIEYSDRPVDFGLKPSALQPQI